jgi:hypothetical protein
MAYELTWAEASDAVRGEKRLLTILVGTGDTADDHPRFDYCVALASRLIDQALHRGGFETPMVELTDATLKNDLIGLWIGELTRNLSSREPWMDSMEAAARAHLDLIANGEITDLIGVELEVDTVDLALTEGAMLDERIFDVSDPFAPVVTLFPRLGQPRRS